VARENQARELSRARRATRKVLVQALYQLQLAEQPWQDIYQQHVVDPDSVGSDPDYFKELLMHIATERVALDVTLARYSDILPERLDPIEHGILWIALYELQQRLDVPFRVAISEAVELTKRFGATDGHKFVNGVLDRAASELRPGERGQ